MCEHCNRMAQLFTELKQAFDGMAEANKMNEDTCKMLLATIRGYELMYERKTKWWKLW